MLKLAFKGARRELRELEGTTGGHEAPKLCMLGGGILCPSGICLLWSAKTLPLYQNDKRNERKLRSMGKIIVRV